MTFSQAFAQARKEGKKTFEWKGNHYSTKLKEETKNPTHVSKDKNAKTKAVAVTKSQAKKNEDKGIMGYYMLPEMTATAARLKIDNKTPGFIPVKNSLVDKQGNPRVHKDYTSGEFFVTDNQGNIIGSSYDPNAANPDFKGWNIYTGTLNDAQRAEAGYYMNQATINEINQKDQQKKERQMMGEEGIQKAIRDGRNTFAKAANNMVANSSNMVNHALLGPARALFNDNYSLEDYAQGFNLTRLAENNNQTVGLGDVFEVENPWARGFLNFANPTTAASVKFSLPSGQLVPGKGKIYNVQVANPIASKYTYTKTPVYAKGWGNQATAGKLNQQWAFPTAPELKTTPGSLSVTTPYNAAFFDINNPVTKAQTLPTAVFDYEGIPDNRTVLGRIQTGDFVPGTTAPNWNSGDYRMKVYDNIKGYRSKGLEGTPAGKAAKNKSSLYMPIPID